jgi:hypothetical protein
MNRFQEFAGYAAQLDQAKTPADVGAVYLQMVGYDCAAEDPEATLEDLLDLARGFIREFCFDCGIHTADIGLIAA